MMWNVLPVFSKMKLQNSSSMSNELDVNSMHKNSFIQICIKVIFTPTWTLQKITIAQLSRKSSQCIRASPK